MEKQKSGVFKSDGNVEHREAMDSDTPATPENVTAVVEDIPYGPGGIRGIVASLYVFGAAFLASLGDFSFGYDQGVISIINVMPSIYEAVPRA